MDAARIQSRKSSNRYYRAFKALPAVRRNETFSPTTVIRLRTIRHCALVLIGFVAVGEMFIVFGGNEDRPPGVFMGRLIAVSSLLIAVAASKLATAGVSREATSPATSS